MALSQAIWFLLQKWQPGYIHNPKIEYQAELNKCAPGWATIRFVYILSSKRRHSLLGTRQCSLNMWQLLRQLLLETQFLHYSHLVAYTSERSISLTHTIPEVNALCQLLAEMPGVNLRLTLANGKADRFPTLGGTANGAMSIFYSRDLA